MSSAKQIDTMNVNPHKTGIDLHQTILRVCHSNRRKVIVTNGSNETVYAHFSKQDHPVAPGTEKSFFMSVHEIPVILANGEIPSHKYQILSQHDILSMQKKDFADLGHCVLNVDISQTLVSAKRIKRIAQVNAVTEQVKNTENIIPSKVTVTRRQIIIALSAFAVGAVIYWGMRKRR